MPNVKRFVFLLAVYFLAGCSLWSRETSLPEMPLLPPGAMTYAQQVTQQVSIDFQGTQQTLIAAWIVDQGVLKFVGVTPTGQRLLTLTYDGKNFTEHYSELVVEPIPGREVLVHLQLAHWPEKVIAEELENTSWRVSFTDGQRKVYFHKKLIMTIYRDDASPAASNDLPRGIKVVSNVADYQLNIKTL